MVRGGRGRQEAGHGLRGREVQGLLLRRAGVLLLRDKLPIFLATEPGYVRRWRVLSMIRVQPKVVQQKLVRPKIKGCCISTGQD